LAAANVRFGSKAGIGLHRNDYLSICARLPVLVPVSLKDCDGWQFVSTASKTARVKAAGFKALCKKRCSALNQNWTNRLMSKADMFAGYMALPKPRHLFSG